MAVQSAQADESHGHLKAVPSTKPRVFVGSSREGLPVARVVAAHLGTDFDAKVWDQGLFRPGLYPLESLDKAIRASKFAVIVGTPDDVLTKRKKRTRAIRDNLIFELGLFMGVLGRHRALLLTPEGVMVAIPSDLDGLTRATYPALPGPPESKDSLDILQVEVTRIREAFRIELGHERARDEKRRARRLASQKARAMKRLFKAVVQLRDLFIEVPTEAIAALGDYRRFEGVREKALKKIDKLLAGWEIDSRIVGVERELDALAIATKQAVRAFPYPALVFALGEQDEIANRIAGRLRAGLDDGGVPGAVKAGAEQVRGELERKLQEFAEKYSKWWARSSIDVRSTASDLQDALSTKAITGFDEASVG